MKSVHAHKRPRFRVGWTLPELLVVLAIIALLIGILSGVFVLVRGKSRETVCLSHLRQIGLALKMYQQDWKELPPRLEALYPTYVSSKELLICRSQRSVEGKLRGGYWSNYIYWFSYADVLNRTPLDGAPPASHASWEEAHAKRGERAPMVTCGAHIPGSQPGVPYTGPGPWVNLVLRLDGSCERRASDRVLFWWEY